MVLTRRKGEAQTAITIGSRTRSGLFLRPDLLSDPARSVSAGPAWAQRGVKASEQLQSSRHAKPDLPPAFHRAAKPFRDDRHLPVRSDPPGAVRRAAADSGCRVRRRAESGVFPEERVRGLRG